jgi:hypothetical protein
LRWWDGTQWTEHVHTPAAPPAYGLATPLSAPEGTNPNTVWAWLIALTPIVSLVGAAWYYSTLPATFGAGSSTQMMSTIYTPAYFIVRGLSLLGYAAAVIFGWRDWRALKARNVPKPFHWAWSFLGAPLVYIIGRTVVVRRRTGRGFGPLWLTIAVIVIGLVIAIVEIVGLFSSIAANLSQTGNY